MTAEAVSLSPSSWRAPENRVAIRERPADHLPPIQGDRQLQDLLYGRAIRQQAQAVDQQEEATAPQRAQVRPPEPRCDGRSSASIVVVFVVIVVLRGSHCHQAARSRSGSCDIAALGKLSGLVPVATGAALHLGRTPVWRAHGTRTPRICEQLTATAVAASAAASACTPWLGSPTTAAATTATTATPAPDLDRRSVAATTAAAQCLVDIHSHIGLDVSFNQSSYAACRNGSPTTTSTSCTAATNWLRLRFTCHRRHQSAVHLFVRSQCAPRMHRQGLACVRVCLCVCVYR